MAPTRFQRGPSVVGLTSPIATRFVSDESLVLPLLRFYLVFLLATAVLVSSIDLMQFPPVIW